MDALKLRRAVAEDAAAVRALTRAAYAKWVPLIGREPKPMQADYERAVCEHRIDLALRADELAGLIENVAVAPAFQGKGVGRRLMAHAERLAVELGRTELRLYTNARFTENVALYRRLGYRIDREESGPLGLAVYMSKPVSAQPSTQ
jgi:ribosomal protein S18 acetylase RimI-like enzyme